MVVGHNPGIEELVEELTGEWVRMPTSALAQIDLAIDNWSDLELEETGKLVNVWLLEGNVVMATLILQQQQQQHGEYTYQCQHWKT